MRAATGRSIQLTKQVGEYLVAAELCRRGLIATTFTGSVPDFDIVAVRPGGDRVLVQVKTIRGGSFQFADARVFLEIRQDGAVQIPGPDTAPPYPDLICVFVLLGGGDRDGVRDRLFILKWIDLQRVVSTGYRANIKRLGGVRPRRHDSYHVGLKPSELAVYEDDWGTISVAAAESAHQQ